MKKYLLLIVAITTFFGVESKAQTLAFPTAEGFGAYAVGGRGGKIVAVTNLEDAIDNPPEGSFRWALQQYPGEPITVIFKVSGVINLAPYESTAKRGELRCKRDNFTIAGQTAPGDGICIRGNKVNFGGSTNFIIRHMRFRIGVMLTAAGAVHADGAGSIGIENASNFIIDHCTFGWSGEENMTVYDNHYSTVQWSIIHEGLYASGHNKGARSYAAQWGGSPATYHHNLIANNVSRSVRFNGASNVSGDRNVILDYVNNVNYNWASSGACYGGEREVNGATHECNFVNNYYKRGPATSGTIFIAPSRNRSGKVSVGPASWYLLGNKMVQPDGSTVENVTSDNWAGISNNTGYTIDEIKSLTPVTIEEKYKVVSTQSADDAYLSVLEKVGAFPRDAVDTRIVEETKTGTASGKGTVEYFLKGGSEQKNPYFDVQKGIIDAPEGAGGYPTYNSTEALLDTDGDGMPDAWETANGLDPNDPEDGKKLTASGYSVLEVYLNGLVGEHIELDFTSVNTELDNSAVNISLSGDNLLFHSTKLVNYVTVYNSLGQTYLAKTVDANSVNVSSLNRGLYIVKAYDNEGKSYVSKILKSK